MRKTMFALLATCTLVITTSGPASSQRLTQGDLAKVWSQHHPVEMLDVAHDPTTGDSVVVGRVLMGHTPRHAKRFEAFVTRLKRDGSKVFDHRFRAGDHMEFGAATLLPDGGFAIAGTAREMSPELGVKGSFVARFNVFGRLLWARNLATGVKTRLRRLAVAPGGDLVVCGYRWKGWRGDRLAMRLSASGKVQWRHRPRTGGVDDTCHGMALDAQGRVYLAGRWLGRAPSKGLIGERVWQNYGYIEALSAKGKRRWIRRVSGLGNTWGSDVAMARGAVFVGFRTNGKGGPKARILWLTARGDVTWNVAFRSADVGLGPKLGVIGDSTLAVAYRTAHRHPRRGHLSGATVRHLSLETGQGSTVAFVGEVTPRRVTATRDGRAFVGVGGGLNNWLGTVGLSRPVTLWPLR